MSKILSADEISAALEGAKDEKAVKAVHKQIILSVKEQEAQDVKNLELIAKVNADLEAAKNALSEKDAKIEELTNKLADADQTIAELGSEISITSNEGGNAVIVVHKKNEYKIIGDNFYTRKGRFSAKELAKDDELIAEMIEKNSGAIIKVTK